MKKFLKILLLVIIIAIAVVYPIYVVVVNYTSRSPDPISMFPKDGVYTCTQEGFTLTLDLTNIGGDDEEPALSTVLEQMKATIEFGEKKFKLVCTMSGGHGTLICPVAPTDILTFKSASVDSEDENYVQFSVSKYVFEKNEFYLKSFVASKSNKANIFDKVDELHFKKES